MSESQTGAGNLLKIAKSETCLTHNFFYHCRPGRLDFIRFGEVFETFGRNQMLFEFGLELDDMDNMTKVEKKIKEIDQDFDLIMVVEKFSESRILLMELINMNVEEAACLGLNSR